MTVVCSRARPVIHEAGFFAAALTVAGLSVAQWAYASSDAPDWRGYEALYEGSADWLTPNGLAPLFIAFLVGARWVFGPEGYGLFRLVLFALFAGFAGWLAYIMPIQKRLSRASALMTCGAVLTALLLKSVVQIREGVAFVLVLVGVLAILRHNIFCIARSGAAVTIAPLVHAGIASLSGVWLFACALTWAPWKVLKSQWLQNAVGLSALVAGSCLALAVTANSETVAAYAASLGVETSATVQGGAFKIAYWAAVGVVVLVLGRQALACDGKLALAFSVALGVGLLPFAYGFCLGLVLANFNVPAVTSMGIRVLFTGLDLALIMVCLRGRATGLTAGAMVLMLADELRLLAAA
jgi:hypothetical protein